MSTPISRRGFALSAAAAGASALLSRGVVRAATSSKKAAVLADETIGVVKPEFHGHFAEHLGSCTYGGIWVGKNSPIPNVNGYRKGVVDALKELGVPTLRWPGGCFADDYHWRDGIGKNRPKRVNIHWGNYTEDNSFGTHEFVEFCRLIGAEPYFAGNVGTGSPQELRDWIEYCNFPKGSTLSDERAANGSPEPFRIKYWGIGNELWGCGGNLTPEATALEFRRFASFARTFERDHPLYLVGCGPSGNDLQWTRGFMDTLAQQNKLNMMQGFSFHFYQNGSLPAHQFTPEAMNQQFAQFPQTERTVVQQRALLDTYDPARRIGLFLDEWGVWDRIVPDDAQKKGALWMQSTIRSAVGAALGLNIFNRQADKLYAGNIAQMVNVLQSVLLTDGPEGRNTIKTTTYHTFMLYKAHRGKTSVRTEADGNKLPAFGGRGGGGRGAAPQQPEPHDLSISASREGNELVVSLVNPRHDTDMDVDVALRGVTARQGRGQILHDSDLNAMNTFDNPTRVAIKPLEVGVEANRLKVTLPAMSVATVTLQVS
jgi:alpha-N-arabinofuranosidase